jgi:Putative Zn-dependent protease, contains TPR repeats
MTKIIEELQFMNPIRTRAKLVIAIIVSVLFTTLGQYAVAGGSRAFRDDTSRRAGGGQRVDSRQSERLYAIMAPLLRVMDNPEDPRNVRVSITDDQQINAGNAGGGQFVVTRGLLDQASDDQLRGVLAHEIAHEDLGHVAKQQMLGTGLNIGVALLERFFPGSGAITPLAGSLIASSYSRSEELAADQHGVELLRRAGYSKQVMINAFGWIANTSGGEGGGGFLSTHPATEERIQALRRMR